MEPLNITVMYVEDDAALRTQIAFSLNLVAARVIEAKNGFEGIELFRKHAPDIVVTDIRMPVMDGLAMIRSLREQVPDLPVIVCTAFTETDYLLKAIDLGVSGYLPKPLNVDDLFRLIRKHSEPILQRREIDELKRERIATLEGYLGRGTVVDSVVENASIAARCDVPVLIEGETGTGKSRLAQLIHRISSRKQGPFVIAHLAGIPENLVESALFGHERGAFTGADRRRIGYFEAANGGTLLLDDMDAIPLSAQASLLQAVESKSIVPLGKTEPQKVDVRIIAASNRPLKEAVAAGRFRQDLYYRMRGMQIDLTPLRNNPDRLPPLVMDIVQEICEEFKLPFPLIPETIYPVLGRYPWRGNIRELRHLLVEILMKCGDELSPERVRQIIDQHNTTSTLQPHAASTVSDTPQSPHIDDLIAWGVRQSLHVTGDKKMEAARVMGVSYNTFKAWFRQAPLG